MPPVPEKIASSVDTQETPLPTANANTMNGSRPPTQQRSSRHLRSRDDAHPTATKARRRATAYTAAYTPSPHLVEAKKRADALDKQVEKKREKTDHEIERRKEMLREKQRQQGQMRRASLQEERRRGEDERTKLVRGKCLGDGTSRDVTLEVWIPGSFRSDCHLQMVWPCMLMFPGVLQLDSID